MVNQSKCVAFAVVAAASGEAGVVLIEGRS